jgi:hypothetical protein
MGSSVTPVENTTGNSIASSISFRTIDYPCVLSHFFPPSPTQYRPMRRVRHLTPSPMQIVNLKPSTLPSILHFTYPHKNIIVAYRPVDRQRPRNKQQDNDRCERTAHTQQWKYCWKRSFLCGPLRGYITRPTEFSSVSAVQCSWVWWSEVGVFRGLLGFSLCEPLLFEAGSSGTGVVWEPRVRRTSTFGSRYQATTGEDTADWEYLECPIVICGVRRTVRA